jgi:hypothetical protein
MNSCNGKPSFNVPKTNSRCTIFELTDAAYGSGEPSGLSKRYDVMKPQDDPDKVLKKKFEKTIEAVADYVEPGPRNAEETVEKVIETVDNNEVKEALEGFDDKRERAIHIADQDHQDDPIPERKERRDRAAGERISL